MKRETVFRTEKDDTSILTANIIRRVIAFAIDYFMFGFIILLFLIVLAIFDYVSLQFAFYIFRIRTAMYESGNLFQTLYDIYIHIATSVVFIGYFTLLESKYLGGQTIGKKLLGIKVVNKKGNKISLKDSFLRNSTKYILRLPIIGVIFGVIEILLIFNYSVRTGDMIANTTVASGVHKGSFTSLNEEEKSSYK